MHHSPGRGGLWWELRLVRCIQVAVGSPLGIPLRADTDQQPAEEGTVLADEHRMAVAGEGHMAVVVLREAVLGPVPPGRVHQGDTVPAVGSSPPEEDIGLAVDNIPAEDIAPGEDTVPEYHEEGLDCKVDSHSQAAAEGRLSGL
ncbi:hypothetical protein RJZ90_007364 [Blastomyces dermatitidis]